MPCNAAAAPLGAPARPLLRLAGQLCPHPLFRLVTARSLPQTARGAEAFTADSWVALQRRLVHMYEAGCIVDRIRPVQTPLQRTGEDHHAVIDAAEDSNTSYSSRTRASTSKQKNSDIVDAALAKTIIPKQNKSISSVGFLWG